MDELDDCDIGAWLASRPTLAEERNHPNHWFNRGADLYASAGALWYAMQHDVQRNIALELGFGRGYSLGVACLPVYHMMCGLALEVIMKAVLVQRNNNVEKTHSLVKLVELLRLAKSADEMSMLRFYEQAVVGAGRYPVPTRCTDEKLKEYWSLAADVLTSPVKMPSNSIHKICTGNGASSWDRFTAMWSEIASLFKHT